MKYEKKLLYQNLLLALLIILPLWIIKLLEVIFGWELVFLGNHPRELNGITGIITGIFIHADFQHLFNNSVPLFVTSFVLFSNYRKVAWRTLLGIILLSGIWVWVAARPSYHIGASGVVYGLVSFLFFMGVFRKDKKSIAIALLITFLYGAMVWGIFPYDPGISWEGHLLGSVAGIFMAILYWKVDYHPKRIEDLPTDETTNLPYWKYNVEGDIKDIYKKQPEVRIHYSYKKEERSSSSKESNRE